MHGNVNRFYCMFGGKCLVLVGVVNDGHLSSSHFTILFLPKNENGIKKGVGGN